MKRFLFLVLLGAALSSPISGQAGDKPDTDKNAAAWPQWRGPNRDGQVAGPAWPDRLTKYSLKLLWRVKLGPSYSGPIVSQEN